MSLVLVVVLAVLGGSPGLILIVFVVFLFALWRSRFVAWELALTNRNALLRRLFPQSEQLPPAQASDAGAELPPPPAAPD